MKNIKMQICVYFGTSGAGKSFYTKLLILRYRLLGIEQYIIDPEREYSKICKELEGTEIRIGPSSDTYVNIMEIREESLEDGENGYLATKIGKLIGFFNLIFGELNEEEKAILEEKLIDKSLIQEEMKLINGSDTDYITPSGEIYKDYGNNYLKVGIFSNNADIEIVNASTSKTKSICCRYNIWY